MVEQEDFRTKRIVYSILGMEQAIVRKDITYKTVGDNELRLDVYYPSDYEGERQLPAVIFVHGDGPSDFLKDAKDWGCYISWGQLIAASGLIAFTFNHRSTEQLIRLYEAANDVDDLIKYVRDNSESLGIDANTLGIWTCSAGSPLGFRSALRRTPSYVRCIISYYGITDLKVYYDGSEQTPPILSNEVFDEYSASAYLDKEPGNIAPMLIVRAGLDHPKLNASIDRLLTAAIAKNVTIDFMNHPTGHHAFDIDDNNARSREIIKATLAFVKTHLTT